MYRSESAIVLRFTNTRSTDAELNLFKFGASNDSTVTETNTVFSGSGRVDSTTFIYGGGIFDAGTTFVLTYDDASVDTVVIGSETPDAAAARVVSTFSGIGGCEIDAGSSDAENWTITISQVTNGKTPASVNLKGTGGNNILTLTGSEPKPRTSSGVEITGTPGYNFIKESQIGAPIKVYTLDLETTDAQQILQPIQYSKQDVNGNDHVRQCIPTIDPYQYIGSSILNKQVKGFELDGSTQVSFTLKANASLQLNLNYMTLKNCDLFKGALRQQKAVEFMRLLDTIEGTEGGLTKVLVTHS